MIAARSLQLAGALVLGVGLLAAPSGALAQVVAVGAGSTLRLGSGSLDLGCADLEVEGSLHAESGSILGARDVTLLGGGFLDGGSGVISLARNWSNAGTFTAGTSSVNLVDGCSVTAATITGSNTFYNLSLTTSSGKSVAIEAGSTQTISSVLTLAGALSSENRLVLRSTAGGVEASLDPQGSISTVSVDVEDVHSLTNLIEVDGSSILGLNTAGWSFFGLDVPALSWAGAALLILAAIASGHRRLTPRLAPNS